MRRLAVFRLGYILLPHSFLSHKVGEVIEQVFLAEGVQHIITGDDILGQDARTLQPTIYLARRYTKSELMYNKQTAHL